MTRAHDAVDDLLPVGEGGEVVLRSFAVLARFRRASDSAEQAEQAVRDHLRTVRDLYDDTTVELREPDGRWTVDVRFVVASADAETAVAGVHATLCGQGLQPDEAWVAQHLP